MNGITVGMNNTGRSFFDLFFLDGCLLVLLFFGFTEFTFKKATSFTSKFGPVFVDTKFLADVGSVGIKPNRQTCNIKYLQE